MLVDPEAPADIAAGLLRLLSDPQTWQMFAERGYRRVLERYTWPRTAIGYLAAIHDRLAATRDGEQRPLLPFPPYFRDPKPENEPTATELARLYFGVGPEQRGQP